MPVFVLCPSNDPAWSYHTKALLPYHGTSVVDHTLAQFPGAVLVSNDDYVLKDRYPSFKIKRATCLAGMMLMLRPAWRSENLLVLGDCIYSKRDTRMLWSNMTTYPLAFWGNEYGDNKNPLGTIQAISWHAPNFQLDRGLRIAAHEYEIKRGHGSLMDIHHAVFDFKPGTHIIASERHGTLNDDVLTWDDPEDYYSWTLT